MSADVASLRARFPKVTERSSLDHPAVDVAAPDLLVVLGALRDEFGFDMLVDVTAIDWAQGSSPRFIVVYHLFSTSNHGYFRVAAACPLDDSPAVPSATGLWPAANWHEREAYDMFGIGFTGHPDLRRILMWDGYPYFPLRKEFPLAGIETPLPDPDVVAETEARVEAGADDGRPVRGPRREEQSRPMPNRGPRMRAGPSRRRSRKRRWAQASHGA